MKNNYRVQNCCANCKHVFIRSEYDDESSYYCTLNASKRPLCGSVAMKEAGLDNDDYDYEAWYNWAEKHVVVEHGICDEYER